MSVKDFSSFKEKFSLNDNLIQILDSLFEKLISFGYMNNRNKYYYIDKLFNNIDDIYIGSTNEYDYKSGYYDANNKIIYIKNEEDIPSIYLRFLYAMTTQQVAKHKFVSGYSTTQMSTDSYKLEHSKFRYK